MSLGRQTAEFQKANANARAAKALDEIEANVTVLDHEGLIVITNKTWRDFAASNPLPNGTPPRGVEVGANYLSTCLEPIGESSENVALVHDGIRAVLDGKKRSFTHEYPCHSPDKQRWFKMIVKSLRGSKPREVVVIHVDITDRWLAELESFARRQELNAALEQLQVMAGKIKHSIGVEQALSGVAKKLVLSTSDGHYGRAHSEAEHLQLLSKRELEVLTGLVRGERNAAIASRLKLSKKSISTYRSRVLEKLKLQNDAQLVSLAARAGLI